VNSNRRSLRGQVEPGSKKRIIVDDGMFTHGYKVLEFHIFGSDVSSGAIDCTGTLALDEDGALEDWNAGDNRQIGWAGYTQSTSYSPLFIKSIIDPNHIVLTDLFVAANSNATANVNYLVVIEPITLTEQQGIMTLIKERSQDDL
jgi:hypothetical protein